MNNHRNLAKLTGYALLLMAIIAGFSFGFAFPKIYVPGQPENAHSALTEHWQLYKFMLSGILLVLLLDLFVSWTLYLYFKNDHKKLAAVSGFLRIIYSIIFGMATYYLCLNFGFSNNNNALIIENYQSFHTVWSIGLIVFGIHLLLVGVLMKLHKRIPAVLWYLTIIAGASYILVHLLKTAFPQLTALSNTLNNILALPMAVGELGLAVWLIIKGGKIN